MGSEKSTVTDLGSPDRMQGGHHPGETTMTRGPLANRRLEHEAEGDLLIVERERSEIATALRTHTAQVLATVQVGLATIVQLDDLADVQASLSELRDEVRGEFERVQRLANTIRPSVLDDFGLEAAVRTLAETAVEETSIALAVDWAPAPLRLSADEETLVFRIVQEAVRNAVRHGGAKRIRVDLRHERRRLLLDVQDDGQGYNTADTARAGHGIHAMQARARLLQATLQLISWPGQGTLVRLSLQQKGDGQ